MPDPGLQWVRHRLTNALQMMLIIAAQALALPAWLLADRTGVIWALLMVALTTVLAGRVPARLMLVRNGAPPLSPTQAPGLYPLLDELYARALMLSAPRLFRVPSAELNAFAVGTAADDLKVGSEQRKPMKRLGKSFKFSERL